MDMGYKTVSLCPHCAKDTPAHYESTAEGVFLVSACPEHGEFMEHIEKDVDFFRWGYDQEYAKPLPHMALPITYRCNLACKYCYTLSNTDLVVPDRSFDALMKIIGAHEGSLTIIGGEPTIREDLPEIIAASRNMPNITRISVATNGQRIRDIKYLSKLREAGLSFVFFSFNDTEYEMSSKVRKNKLQALENCYKLKIPVWFQGTINEIHQLDSIVSVMREFKKIIFKVVLRPVRAVGVNHPTDEIFMSDILQYLGKKDEYKKGDSPFNRVITLEGTKTKVCIYAFDVGRTDPIDYKYVISDDRVMGLYRGFRTDEVLLRRRLFGDEMVSPDPERVQKVLKRASA